MKRIAVKSFHVILIVILFQLFPAQAQAQLGCTFIPVSKPLTDLGSETYHRMTSTNPPAYVDTGVIGGLYPGGSNVRPAEHEAEGIEIARQIVPLDRDGNPSPSGWIGMASIGMSNTQIVFGRFRLFADADPEVHDRLRFANAAVGGGVIDYWVDQDNPLYSEYWSIFDRQIANYGLTKAQIQVMWVKVSTQNYQPRFPEDMQLLTEDYVELTQLLKARLPNLKLIYFSSRSRSFSYLRGLSPETSAFENGFAVRWLIEKQLNGDPALNYKPENGPVLTAHISWGPYIWIDGENPRLDGEVWPLSSVTGDCTHPSNEGADKIGRLMLAFFKSDPVAAPWFMNAWAIQTPTPSPTPTDTPTPTETPSPTETPTPTDTPTPTETPTPTPTWDPNQPTPTDTWTPEPPTPTFTDTPTPTDTSTPTPTFTSSPSPTATWTPTPTATPDPSLITDTPTPSAEIPGLISKWGFGANAVGDDLNGCSGCANLGATWFTPSIISGGFHFDGSTGYLNLGTFPHLNTIPAFSVSAWVRPEFDQAHSTSWRYVFSDGNNIALAYLSATNDWRFSVRTNTFYSVDTQGLTWTAGSWHLLTGTYDGMVMSLYWDGSLAAVRSLGVTANTAADTGATYLGSSPIRGQKFLGDIDELRIYNRALTPAEVQALYTLR